MAELNLENPGVRKLIISEITGDENKRRKAESMKRFEIYNRRQARFIIEKLKEEFSEQTVNEMRKITSINLVHRIINEQASLYKNPPERIKTDMSEKEEELLEAIYKLGNANQQMKVANRYYKLMDQGAIKILPKNGVIDFRALPPHHFDVIPMSDDPETAFAYVLSSFDKFEFMNNQNQSSTSKTNSAERIDGRNQTIADPDDYAATLAATRYTVWTADEHFVMNGHGAIVTEVEDNEIKMLPFVDVHGEKDHEFFCRRGNGATDFQLDYGVLLSDTANTNRLQSYSQAVIMAKTKPEHLQIGPDRVLFLKQPKNPDDKDPKFEFVTPSPDMRASIDLLEVYLRLFLTSEGVDPKTISGTSDGQRFNSGYERLLSMIDKFEASAEDVEVMKRAEVKAFEIARAWSNSRQIVTDEENGLRDELRLGQINEKSTVEVIHSKPEFVQTKSEQEDSNIKLVDAGLMSKVEAIMELRGLDEDQAKEVLAKIAEEDTMSPPEEVVDDEEEVVVPVVEDEEVVDDAEEVVEE